MRVTPQQPQPAQNPMQMLANMFNGGRLPQFDEGFFRQFLPRIDNEKIEQIKNMAKSFGMSDEQIEQGMSILRRFKN